MATLTRQSPVRLEPEPLRTVVRNDWRVVVEFAGEGDGPYLVDLSHCPRWDVQAHLDAADRRARAGLADLMVPADPGAGRLRSRVLVNRLNTTQAAVWHLHGEPVAFPDDAAFTDVTDASVFLGLLGAGAMRVAERLSDLDFANPGREAPFLLQGPLARVPCQIAVLGLGGSGAGMLLACARGYATDMVAALLRAGAPEGLRPGGEAAFAAWLALHH